MHILLPSSTLSVHSEYAKPPQTCPEILTYKTVVIVSVHQAIINSYNVLEEIQTYITINKQTF